MKWFGLFLVLLTGNGFLNKVVAQCATVDFTIPASSCLNQNLTTTNLSGAGNYLWDFCSGDLNNTPTFQSTFSLSAAIGRPGIEFAKDGSTWYAFVTGTYSNTLYRLTFANGLNNAPTFTENLADLAGTIKGPGQIRIVNESGSWYGLIYNTAAGEILKLSFGNSLSNTITTSVLTNGINATTSGGFAVMKDPVQGWVCVTTNAANSLTLFRLGNTLTSPGASDIINTSTLPNANSLGDVDLINVCGSWYGFATDFGNANVYRLKFGANLFSTPVIDQMTTLPVANPGRVRVAKDGEEYFLVSASLDGNFSKLKFGTDINSSPVFSNEGNIAANVYALAIARENSLWNIITVNLSGALYRINYPNNCAASIASSTQQNPDVTYSQAGTYHVSLDYITASVTSTKTRNVVVSSTPAPDIDFTSQNICANSAVNFTPVNSSGNLTGYSWDFGDGNTSSSPTHIYAASGTYLVGLTVTASNLCSNTVQKSLTIYNPPTAAFTLPGANPYCTNQNYLFTNTSTFDNGSTPTWEWRVNSVLVSSLNDLTTAFTSAAPQQIKLKALLPGCSNEVTQNISTVLTGPAVDFTVLDGCQNTSFLFNNNTTGGTPTYSWDFGDGSSLSTSTAPSHVYAVYGKITPTLTATTANGCQNSTSKTVTVYSTPIPDFSLDLPPFSCSGSFSQFHDATPGPTDSNLTSWAWDFGDGANQPSSQRNPLYKYALAGPFNVSLTVKTNFGCSGTVQKPITIAQSPGASFTNSVACVNQGTSFEDTSTGAIKTWQWKIATSTYSQKSLTHVFGTQGSYTAQLTVTDSAGCIGQTSKPIVVPIAQNPDFSSSGTCATKDAVFQNITAASSDPLLTFAWDFAGGGSGSGASTTFAFPTTGNFSVTMQAQATSGCVYSVTKDVAITAPPTAGFTSSVNAGSAPLSVQFTNTSVNASSYVWHFHDANDSMTSVSSPSFVFNDLGDYVVDLDAINALGCVDTHSGVISVIVPQADASVTDLRLVADAVSGGWQALYVIENKGSSPMVNPSIVVDLSGETKLEESLTLTVKPGDRVSQILRYTLMPVHLDYVCVSVVEADDENLANNRQCAAFNDNSIVMSPYPNPADDELHLDWIALAAGTTQITVYNNAGGRALTVSTDATIQGLNQMILDISSLSGGMYVVVLNSQGTTKSFRFMVRD